MVAKRYYSVTSINIQINYLQTAATLRLELSQKLRNAELFED